MAKSKNKEVEVKPVEVKEVEVKPVGCFGEYDSKKSLTKCHTCRFFLDCKEV